MLNAKREELSYSRIKETYNIPYLIEVQKNSYDLLLKKGLKDAFNSVFPIKDVTGSLQLDFIDYEIEKPKYSISECKDKDLTYSVQVRTRLRLVNRETGEIKEDNVLLCELPFMTPTGTFVINGAERVVVSQLTRSPGIYFREEVVKGEGKIYHSRIIPNRGTWIEFEIDTSSVLWVKVEKSRKFLVTILLKMLGYTDAREICQSMGGRRIKITHGKYEDFLYKVIDKDIIDVQTGQIIFPAGKVIDEACARSLSSLKIKEVDVWEVCYQIAKTLQEDAVSSESDAFKEFYKKIRPGEPPTVEAAKTWFENAFLDVKKYDLGKVGRYRLNKKLGLPSDIVSSVLRKEDIIESIRYLIGLSEKKGEVDDIDHLGNRRVRAVGEQIQNQFRIGLLRLEKLAREKMMTQEKESITPSSLVNIRPIIAVLNEFFGTSQLSQFMDQINPLAEITHKRRLSTLGPGGLTRERAGVEVRDVHHTYYGRICPIETPEGPNIGLINSMSCFTKVNEYGFMESPYRRVINGKVIDEIVYLTADEEDKYVIAQADTPINENGKIIVEKVAARFKDANILATPDEVEFMDVSPKQIVSVSTALIPFLEHNDANRALMGSNMQRQAVPLLISEAPVVQTGIEEKIARDSGAVVISDVSGQVIEVDATKIVVQAGSGENYTYHLKKTERSNQSTCINQIPIVRLHDKVKKGQVLADGQSTAGGELALGRNLLIAYMPWEGYNFEDAIVISERLVKDDVYTSLHIEEYEIEARDTKLGPEEITRELPGIQEEIIKDLDERGIVRIGAEVKAEDILVGKITPKGETELTPEEKLLRAIFGDKAKETRDTSLRVPHGGKGKVIATKIFSRDDGDELPPGVNQLVRVYVAQKRKIQEGDKMAGRHGNKGVISKIFPSEDMPCLPDGTPIDIILNPLGVPSRMNIGQILESLLGFAAYTLGIKAITPIFDGAKEYEIMFLLSIAKLIREGEVNLYYANEDIPRFVLKFADDTTNERRDAITFYDKVIKIFKTKTLGLYNFKDKVKIADINFSALSPEEIKASWLDCSFFGKGEVLKEKDANYTIRELKDILRDVKVNENGKITLYDGRSGEPFDIPVVVGCAYLCKLNHLVDDKIHARSIGPYALVTQQPLGGKAQFGGQRFGEMEVWALEAYGSAFTLQELLTVKSDDVAGRVKTYESIIKGEYVLEPGVPESFKVLVKELQAIGIDVNLLSKDETIVQVPEMEDLDDEIARELEKELA